MDADGLRRLAGQWRVPLGVVEKDHAITVILGVVAALPCASQLAFKGGRALRKVHFPDYRFSEDLDFTALSDVADDLAAAGARLRTAGRRAAVDVVGVSAVSGPGASGQLKVVYRDMNDHPNGVRIQLSLREKPSLSLERRPVVDPYGVLEETAHLRTLALSEILAEKIRAVYMRTAPRDLYDLWYLLREGISAPRSLMEEKLRAWRGDATVEREGLLRRVARLEGTWERDLGQLLPEVPPFSLVASEVEAWTDRALPKADGDSEDILS